MKKITTFLLMISMLFILAACSESSAEKVSVSEGGGEEMAEKDISQIRSERANQYLVSAIEYFDSNAGTDLLIASIDKAEKINKGEEFNANEISVEITLKDEFTNTPKGLLLPELITLDLVKNKFNETGVSGINAVHLVVNGYIDGEKTKVYEIEVDEESYKAIHEDEDITIQSIIDKATNTFIHDVYKNEIFNK